MTTKTVDIVTMATSAAAKHLDDLLDEALDESYPASDPVAISVRSNPLEPPAIGIATTDDQMVHSPMHPDE